MDLQLLLLINGTHTDFLDSFMYLLTGKLVWVPFYVSLLYVVWRNYSWRGLLTLAVMVGVAMFFTDWFNAHVLRPVIGRLRPNNPENPDFALVRLVFGKQGGGFCFPSAHAANFWMLTFMMLHWLRNRLLTLTMSVVALLVCYSRVYMAYHYPADILGGFIYAAFIVCMLAFVHRRFLHFCAVKEPRHIIVPVAVAAFTILCFVVLAFMNKSVSV